jgi:hypothetical protein
MERAWAIDRLADISITESEVKGMRGLIEYCDSQLTKEVNAPHTITA